MLFNRIFLHFDAFFLSHRGGADTFVCPFQIVFIRNVKKIYG